MHTPEAHRLRVGPYELDLDSRELRTASGSVRLQEQPCVILQMLVERRGSVVTREELRRRLWPEGTFVDFEHSLNAAVKRLRAVLGDDADHPKFVETIPRRGYRFVADQEEADVRDPGLTESRVRLAVLPFRELGASSQDDYFSHGFTEEMVSELGRRGRGRFGVISNHSSRTFKDTTLRARDIGLALRADYLLEGSIRQSGGRVRISARLIESTSETQLWVETYEQPLTDWLAVQAEIATRIARSLEMELLPGDFAARARSRDAAASEAFLKGRYHYQRLADTGAREALRFFQEAASRDPSFASAHAGVAMVEVMRASYYHEVPRAALERARASATRALQLDPEVPEAHLAHGDVQRLLAWDLHGARAAYAKAIVLNPSLESARTAHARLLVSLGRFAQAVREADLGRELDPRCLTANTLAAWARHAAGDHDTAIDLCRHTLELSEHHAVARQLLGSALLAIDSPKEAIRVLEHGLEGRDPNPILLASLAYVHAVSSDRAEAERLIEQLDALALRRYVSPYYRAIAYAGLGALERAFDALEQACDDRDPAVANLAIERRLSALRVDARFADLLGRLGLSDLLSSGTF